MSSEHPDRLPLTGADQFKALANPLRRRIIDLATERPATVAEFADALGRPPGTIAHHVKLLVEAGLLVVVESRRVRSVQEHYYGRTAPTFVMPNADEREAQMLADLGSARRPPETGEPSFLGVRFLRIPDRAADELVAEFIARLESLALESGEGTTVYGVVLGILPTNYPTLPTRIDNVGD
jgi:DNA-binding transcriptional ArsR family regulator